MTRTGPRQVVFVLEVIQSVTWCSLGILSGVALVRSLEKSVSPINDQYK